MQQIYELQEKIARLKEKYYEIELESKHFKEFAKDTGSAVYETLHLRRNLSPDKIMQLLLEVQNRAEESGKLSLLFKLKCFWLYGIADWKFYKQDISKIITAFKGLYYVQSLKEITEELQSDEKELAKNIGDYGAQLEEKSLKYLKAVIAEKYAWKENRMKFSDDKLFRDASQVLEEYPIVLSTTFSARASLNAEYDYVISGHSHIPHYVEHFFSSDDATYRNKKRTIFINPGSVGQPRNQNPYAQYAVISFPSKQVELRAVEYDVKYEQSLYPDEIDEFYRMRLTRGI